MSVYTDGLGSGITFHDVMGCIHYIERKYNAYVEILISSYQDGTNDAMLLVTVIAQCGVSGHHQTGAGTHRRISYKSLRLLPSMVLSDLYEAMESLDGSCPECQAAGKNLRP